MVRQRRLAPDHGPLPGPGSRLGAHRLDDCPRSPARCWSAKKGATPEEAAAREGLGRSRGGLTTKVHAACDALGNPLRLLLTPGQRNDITQADALVAGYDADAVIADRGYDADWLVTQIAEAGAAPVIPPKKNRTEQRDYDAELYKERNAVERFFGRLKLNRRVATRYEKKGRNYLSFVFWASALVLLL